MSEGLFRALGSSKKVLEGSAVVLTTKIPTTTACKIEKRRSHRLRFQGYEQ